MAFPFGGHPTFARYIEWARGEGCTIETGVDTAQSVSVTKIINRDATRWVIVAGILPADFLVPTTVGMLDRRLGLISPWVAAPLNS
jgi:hypothetical protein